MRFPTGADDPTGFKVVERTGGGSGTEFGVPSSITELDRVRVTAKEATRRAGLVLAAPGPSSTGSQPERRRNSARARVAEAGTATRWSVTSSKSDAYYAREIGIRRKPPDPTDRAAIEAMRDAMLEILRKPSDGAPLAERTWTTRYAARRIAWHALDHAWEMEDRTEP